MGGIRRRFLILCVIFVAVGNTLLAQKAPSKDGGLDRLFKDFDALYQDMESQLTVKMFMTGEGWNSLRTVSLPIDPTLAVFQFQAFAALDPWYYFTLEYKFKPLRFLTLTLYANIMPEASTRVFPYTVQGVLSEASGTANWKNSYQDLQAEASFDIGPGEMTLSARYFNRTDKAEQSDIGNGYSPFMRALTLSGTGWTLDPTYNFFVNAGVTSKEEYRYQKVVLSLKNQKQLVVEPSITLTGQYLEVINPSTTNLNYDPWSAIFNIGTYSTYGRAMPSFLVNKLTLSVDGKLTLRPVENVLTIVVGGTVTPTYPIVYQTYLAGNGGVPYPIIVNTISTYLNLDLRLSPRLLWQNTFNLTTQELRYTDPHGTVRYLDDFESPGWMGRFFASERDLWKVTFSTGFVYK